VDYSGPNVAKELHAGHLRATAVGEAIARVLGYLGYTVIRAAHLGDWGTPFGMLIEHTLDLGDEATGQLDAGEFTAFYQGARSKFDTDPAFAARARQRVVALQAGDEESLRIWRMLVAESMAYLRKIYTRLDIRLTDSDMDPESFYNPMLADVCAELEGKGIAVQSEGALCVFPPGFTGRGGKPVPVMLRKSDGGYGYATTDVAAIRYRLTELHASRIIYVVGSEQHLHLEMLFAVAAMAGWLTGDARAEHAIVGLMTGPGGQRLQTRTGEQVKLVTLIDEAVQRAEKVIAERYPDPAERAEIAEAVGIGALKYADLSSDREKDYVFSWDRMLSLEGNTAVYLQYANARIRSILRRADEEGGGGGQASVPIVLAGPAERELALKLAQFPAAVQMATARLQPHRICTYLYETATAFSAFYESCSVLNAGTPELRASRLALSELTSRTLTLGLNLLGIEAPERL
jgi:arginyl-tRNA synthetase